MAVIAVIRMKGKFSLPPDPKKTLDNLRLRKLYSCTLVSDSGSYRGMLQTAKDLISFGQIEKKDILLLLTKRGHALEGNKKLSLAKKPEEIEKMASEIAAGKKLVDAGVSPVFHLSPPRGGFGTRSRKAQPPYGPLGKNPKIVDLISRMA